MQKAGYTATEIAAIKKELEHFEKARNQVKLASGDYIDLKMHEPAILHPTDTYIRAEAKKSLPSMIFHRSSSLSSVVPTQSVRCPRVNRVADLHFPLGSI